MEKTEIIPVFTACDGKYFPFTAVMVRSVLNWTPRPVSFQILHDGSLTSGHCRSIKSLLPPGKKYEIAFHKMKLDSHFRTWCGRFPPLVYFRLLIPSMFPQFDRCIYLDSDIIVRKDLRELYETDLHGKLIGAVPESDWLKARLENRPLFGKFSNLGLRDYSDRIGLKKVNVYYNSGVLLMDLKNLRLRGMRVLESAYNRAGDDLLYPDQDLLNLYLNEEIYPLHRIWNAGIRHSVPPGRAVLHFVSKPWHNSSIDADRALYWNELRSTPWFYRVRAELLLHEFEASINSVWRCPGDCLFAAAWKLLLEFVCCILRRCFFRKG